MCLGISLRLCMCLRDAHACAYSDVYSYAYTCAHVYTMLRCLCLLTYMPVHMPAANEYVYADASVFSYDYTCAYAYSCTVVFVYIYTYAFACACAYSAVSYLWRTRLQGNSSQRIGCYTEHEYFSVLCHCTTARDHRLDARRHWWNELLCTRVRLTSR